MVSCATTDSAGADDQLESPKDTKDADASGEEEIEENPNQENPVEYQPDMNQTVSQVNYFGLAPKQYCRSTKASFCA